jgi:hypothetical protein
MDNFYARSVFFVNDAETSLAFYTQTLEFAWTGIISTKAVRGSLK